MLFIFILFFVDDWRIGFVDFDVYIDVGFFEVSVCKGVCDLIWLNLLFLWVDI